MTDYMKGMRVLAMASGVEFFGFGTFEGNEVPPSDVFIQGQNVTTPNPKIALDNGDVVYGCECWWGPTDQFPDEVVRGAELLVAGKPVNGWRLITVAEYRAKSKQAAEEIAGQLAAYRLQYKTRIRETLVETADLIKLPLSTAAVEALAEAVVRTTEALGEEDA